MKKIEAIIQPNKLHNLKTALATLGVNGMTISDVKGFGKGRGYAVERGAQVQVEFVPKVKAEIIVKDQHSEVMIEAICEVCYTGEVGDGKIFVIPVEEAVRIRTGERGEDAVK